MSQHADEGLDLDPLLEFANEPASEPAIVVDDGALVQAAENVEVTAQGSSPAPSSEAFTLLMARLDRLERNSDGSSGELAALKAEVATLVGVIEDIRKRDVRRAAMSARSAAPRIQPRNWPSLVFAIVGLTVGMALGITGWMLWSRGTTASVQAMTAPVAEPAPIEQEPLPQATVMLASTPPDPAPASHVSAAETEDRRPPERYVGTLSIDAEPGGEVFINRAAAGHTPLRIANLKAGSHLVWIERDGYQRWTKVVQVPSDRVSRVSAQLEPLASP